MHRVGLNIDGQLVKNVMLTYLPVVTILTILVVIVNVSKKTKGKGE